MFNATLKGLWARKRRLIGTSLAVVLGVAFLAATLVLGDTMRSGFDQAFAEANAGLDVVVRSSDEIGSGDSASPRRHRRVHRRPGRRHARRARRGPDGRRRRHAARRRRRAASAATVRRPTARTGSTIPTSTRTTSPRAAPPAPPARSSSTAARPTSGDLHVGDTTTVLTPTPIEVTIVGIATFGDVDSLGPTTYTAFTLPQATRAVRRAARHDLVGPRGRRGRRQPGDAAPGDHRAAAGAHRGADRKTS